VKRVGFIINSRVPEPASLRKGMLPYALATGWDDSGSPMSFMRFRWLAEALRASRSEWHYEIYRPWRHYSAVVFLKSMGSACHALAGRLREKGTCVIFEANVDYYTRFEGEPRLDVMAPSAEQRSQAVAMTQSANAVVASSWHLSEICRAFNPRTTWIPDNVNFALRPPRVQTAPFQDGRLQVWWSGMAAKLFEFLAAEEVFVALADRIHLQLVTDDLEKAKLRWPDEIRQRFEKFLTRVPHTLHRYRDIPQLLASYGGGGVIVSPRFLDTPYNLSHSEWKISLGMACELPAIASPVPSYVEMQNRAGDQAVTICRSHDEWLAAFEGFLTRPGSLAAAGREALEVVKSHYETGVVARQHAAWVERNVT